MSAQSPSKRRRTMEGLNLERLTVGSSTVDCFAVDCEEEKKDVQLRWPPGDLPIELFNLIATHLPRSTIQNMRLVNKEFEKKVSGYLFRSVVVPFKHEIFGVSELDLGQNAVGDILLQDIGMRVFQGYGGRIIKFAMSFEINEAQLFDPPMKCEQEAIVSFWGIYRWPFKNYTRFQNLEGMEQTADETKTMTKALRFIDNAKELGLSIDGGLGWLAGPDINVRYQERNQKLVVFGDSRFAPELEPKPIPKQNVIKGPMLRLLQGKSPLYAAFEQMLHEAGYRGATLESSIRMMLESEQGTPEVQNQAIVNGFSSTMGWDSARFGAAPSSTNPTSSRPMINHLSPDNNVATNDDHPTPRAALAAMRADLQGTVRALQPTPSWNSLKPKDLNIAQKEILLETEWAQRAFIQSYAIAVIDSPLTFQRVRTLTIARLPSRHVSVLRRSDFWNSLAQLNKFSLAVIPDWREVLKLPTGDVRDHFINPSNALSPVYHLLRDQISNRKNIKDLHFEWLCGGEFAPGLYIRNKHILAAPLLPRAMDLLQKKPVKVLRLPHVERLSLKNCWITPHIMKEFSVSLRKASLQFLTLETVSLTAHVLPTASLAPLSGIAATNAHVAINPHLAHGPLPPGHAAFTAAQAAYHQTGILHPPQYFQNLINAQGNAAVLAPVHGIAPNINPNNAPMPPPPPHHLQNPGLIHMPIHFPPPFASQPSLPPTNWWDRPRYGSWAEYIDYMTPAETLHDLRHKWSPDMNSVVPHRDRGNIIRIDFKSCGYVRLPLTFDQRAIDSPDLEHSKQLEEAARRADEIFDVMMRADDDHCLGVITGFMDKEEVRTLEEAWGMDIGWGNRRREIALEATDDGVGHPGAGRLDGSVYKDLGAPRDGQFLIKTERKKESASGESAGEEVVNGVDA